MLGRFSVKGRMALIILSILLISIVMTYFAIRTGNRARDLGIEKAVEIMMANQREKIQVASHSMAVTLGHALRTIPENEKKISAVQKMLDEIRFEKDSSGYFFVFENTTNLVMPINKSKQGKDLGGAVDKNGVYFVRELYDAAKKGGGFVEYIWEKKGVDTPKLSYAEMIPGSDMWVGTGVYLDNLEAHSKEIATGINDGVAKTLTLMLIISGALFALIIALCMFIAFGIIDSLKSLILSFKDIAEGEGDLTKRVVIKGKDEIAELAHWFNTFLAHLQDIMISINKNTGVVGGQSGKLNSIAANLSDSARQTSERSDNVAAAAEEMSSNMNSVASAMEQSTTNTSMVAGAAEEMTATINEIATNAEEAHNISERAVNQANKTSNRMTELGDAAEAISKVTETITEISEQTNLLALNATIEAARAGEAGKGFAVVANEIKELAKQTAEATLDIKNQIDGVQGTTSATVNDIAEIVTIIKSVNELVATISSSVDEQSAATEEIANNINQAAQGLGEVNENVSQISMVASTITEDIAMVNSASIEIAEGSTNVDSSSGDLSGTVRDLQETLSKFKIS